ncbi:MAG TPA: DUF2752 domain-containing protein [Pilimelia sp.]|nr:DUF2752 domain-containing protein [Pilimelia sp.]
MTSVSDPVDGQVHPHAYAPPGAEVPPPGGWPPPYPVPQPDRFTLWVTRVYARSPRWLAPAAILACFAGAAAYVLASDPTDVPADAAPSCIVKLTTGFDCPGCGGTRAFFYLLHGNLPAAARHHLLFLFAVPFLVYLYAAWAADQLFGRKLPPLRLRSATIGAFLVAWLLFTVARNLPWAPFTSFYV